MSGSESGDEAPTAVSFKQSQVDHENIDNQIRDFLKERRDAEKEKRRLKNETMILQRETKKKQEKQEDEAISSSDLNTELKYQQKKRYLPQTVVNSLKEAKSPTEFVPAKKTNKVTKDQSTDEDMEHSDNQRGRTKPKRMKRKIYRNLNIRVEALNQLESKRTSAAMDFKTRRLGKIHRENVDNNRIHMEKLKASGQNLKRDT